jgi:hypothetical protein
VDSASVIAEYREELRPERLSLSPLPRLVVPVVSKTDSRFAYVVPT